MVDVNLIVARARIAGRVEVTSEAPEQLHIHAGDVVQVKLPFRFDETSNREDYDILLRIEVDGETQEATFEGKDRPAVSDDRRGFVMVEHAFLAAGIHKLQFHAACTLASSDWAGGEAEMHESIVEGDVSVEVQ